MHKTDPDAVARIVYGRGPAVGCHGLDEQAILSRVAAAVHKVDAEAGYVLVRRDDVKMAVAAQRYGGMVSIEIERRLRAALEET